MIARIRGGAMEGLSMGLGLWVVGMVWCCVLGSVVKAQAQTATYTIAQNFTGEAFFDGWIFYSGLDVNNTGNVWYLDEQDAMQQQLAYVNSVGNVVLKVDNVTNGVGNNTYGRNSVRIYSKGTFYIGSLIIMDAVHMPYGCSVWPAFWSQGPVWPDNGEIDIVEQVNLAPTNQHALHTLSGCTHPPASQSTGLESGNLLTTDCFNQTNFNSGCLVQDPSPSSYGAAFAQNGGGVYALLWDESGMKIWFFGRSDIPGDVAGASPNPAGWGIPTAFYPSDTCDFQQFFTPQTLIFDINICGSFGLAAFPATCQGNCLDLVGQPSVYDTAYFELQFVRIFTNGSSPGTSTSLTSTSTSTSTTTAPTSTSTTTVTTSSSGSSQTGSGSGTQNNAAAHRRLSRFLSGDMFGAVVGIVCVLMW